MIMMMLAAPSTIAITTTPIIVVSISATGPALRLRNGLPRRLALMSRRYVWRVWTGSEIGLSDVSGPASTGTRMSQQRTSRISHNRSLRLRRLVMIVMRLPHRTRARMMFRSFGRFEQ